MNRSRARAGSAGLLALLFVIVLFGGMRAPVRAESAQPVPPFWFAGTRLIFARADRVDDEIAVRGSDPGLQRFLARVGATLSWVPGARYVIVTTADRRTLTFTLGVPEFQTSAGNEEIPFHAYIDGNDVYLPFLTLARALYVRPVLQGGEYVLQPQIGALDARVDGRKTIVTLHGATMLRYTKSVDAPDKLTLLFRGMASTLETYRVMEMPGVSRIDVNVGGDLRNPSTAITFDLVPGAGRVLLPSRDPDSLALAFAPKDVALAGQPIPGAATASAATATPVLPAAAPRILSAAPPTFAPIESPSPAVVAQAGPSGKFITTLDVENPAPDALLIHVAASSGISFEWHRLGFNRFYIDFAGAMMTFEPQDRGSPVPFVPSYRMSQLQGTAVPTVRLAITTTPSRRIDVVPDGSGVTITVADVDSGQDFVAQVGSGQTGGDNVAVVPTATPGGIAPPPGAIPPPGSNPRLIVIDPGHGGSDTGSMHNGLVEKDVTLDIALRLRTLLIARGWVVKMTRDADRDVYGPNASDVDELQARVDVANNAGARMFVSIHANASTSAVPNGTTSYWYKPEDRSLAVAVQRRLISQLGTKDDGVVRERFYVIRRTTMPATLVETAFLSNADDAAKLRSPAFRQQIAAGIADGIKDYAGQPGSAVSQQ
ncbi:MAG: N-acetylmuramoyl-L-alanine amidase family protein [Vulcanimicrobiaceae bacterium]